jgi:hypothetical protein
VEAICEGNKKLFKMKETYLKVVYLRAKCFSQPMNTWLPPKVKAYPVIQKAEREIKEYASVLFT